MDQTPTSDCRSLPEASLTPQQGVALYLDLLETCHQLLMAGLRQSVGPDGDVRAAYIEWNRRASEEHEKMFVQMAKALERAERNHATQSRRANS